MRLRNKNIALILLMLMTLILSSCFLQKNTIINIADIRTTKGIDEKLKPVGITNIFPDGTQKVFCWFQWKDTEVNTIVMARWYFLTDNIHILDYNFMIPRRQGSGSVSLTMPEGKKLPAGLYRVDLNFGKQTLKSATFKIQ